MATLEGCQEAVALHDPSFCADLHTSDQFRLHCVGHEAEPGLLESLACLVCMSA